MSSNKDFLPSSSPMSSICAIEIEAILFLFMMNFYKSSFQECITIIVLIIERTRNQPPYCLQQLQERIAFRLPWSGCLGTSLALPQSLYGRADVRWRQNQNFPDQRVTKFAYPWCSSSSAITPSLLAAFCAPCDKNTRQSVQCVSAQGEAKCLCWDPVWSLSFASFLCNFHAANFSTYNTLKEKLKQGACSDSILQYTYEDSATEIVAPSIKSIKSCPSRYLWSDWKHRCSFAKIKPPSSPLPPAKEKVDQSSHNRNITFVMEMERAKYLKKLCYHIFSCLFETYYSAKRAYT